MKIQNVTINKYKAFTKEEKIPIGGTAVEKLKDEIKNVKKNKSINKLEKEISKLTSEIAGKDKLIENLGNKLKTK